MKREIDKQQVPRKAHKMFHEQNKFHEEKNQTTSSTNYKFLEEENQFTRLAKGKTNMQ